MNAIFQVIQNILRRKEQKNVCPHCGRPLPPRDGPRDSDASGPDTPHCPSCGHPLSGGDTR